MSSKHKETYFKFFNLVEGDFIRCSITGEAAVDVHAIMSSGMGGNNDENRIENLIPLSRAAHQFYGGKQQFKPMLYKIVFCELMMIDKELDRDVDYEWIINQIKRYQ